MTSRKSATSGEESVVVGNPYVPNYRSKVNARKYYSMKKVLLNVFPIDVHGITQSEMMREWRPGLPKDLFPARTYMWWAKWVQLDMESKRELVRDDKAKPLRWRLAQA